MKKTAIWIQCLVFLAFITCFFLLNLILPDRSFSQQENRVLQSAPKFTVSSLLSGKFTETFEDYVTDQFAFRDRWTTLKARCELAMGKNENNGVYLCRNETLIEPFTAPEAEDLSLSLEAVDTLAKSNDIPVYFGLIPSASEIWSDYLPAGAPNDSQKDFIDDCYRSTAALPVDIYSALASHKEENVYYRTDHHWTTLGAYYGYTALAEAMGFEPVPLSDYTKTPVTDEFLGSTYSKSGFSWVRPDSISTYVEQGDCVIHTFSDGAETAGSLYVESFLEQKDKYSYFYGGNTPLVTVTTPNTDAPRLLILRDSYMDSLSPYLFAHFSEIHILDLRYYRLSLKEYISSHEIDSILVCYNVKNFAEDGNIFLAAY